MPKKHYKRRKSAFAIQRVSRTNKMLGENRVNFTNLRQVVQTVEKLATNLSPERKFNEDASVTAFYTITLGTPLDYSTIFAGIANNVQQGTGTEERVGNKIRNTDMTWKLLVRLDDSAVPAEDNIFYRCIILVQKIASSVTVTADQVLHEYLSNPDTSIQISMITGINRNFSSNYVILKDKVYTLNDLGAGNTRYHKTFKKLNFETEFFSANANDIKSNTIWYFVIPMTSTANQFSVTSYMRLNYTDV